MKREKKQLPLWKIILERHKYTGRLLRPRVPLVFLRLRTFREAAPSRKSRASRESFPPRITQYPLNLHLQLSFPWAQSIVQMNSVANVYSIVMDQRNRMHPRSIVYQTVDGGKRVETRTDAQRLFQTSISHAGNRDGLWRVFHTSVHRDTTDERSDIRSTEKTISTSSRAVQTRESKEVERASSSSAVTTHSVSNFTRSVMSAFDHAQTHYKQINYNQSNHALNNFNQINFKQIDHASIGEQMFHRFNSIASLNVANVPTLRVMPRPERVHGLRTNHEFANQPLRPYVVRPYVGFALPKPPHQELRSATTTNSPLYTKSISRTFAAQPQHLDTAPAQTHHQPAPPPTRVSAPAPQPLLDIARLSDEVYRHIQQKIRVDRERRGL